ncbi:MAG: HPF/RaiA family ribosome-associated protein [Polyangiales bacterium]
MAVAIQITFRGIQPFEGAQKIVQDKLATLEHQLPEGARCHVTVERAVVESESAKETARVHARVHLLGTGLLVSTAAHDDDEAGALRLALVRAESKLGQTAHERRGEPTDLAL